MERRQSGITGSSPDRPAVSRKAVDLAKNLLSSMFMAIRTAKIHDPSNSAFETAVQSVFRAAEALFQATGGFSLQFVEDTIFLNGSRLRFESSAFSTMRTLRRLMEEEGLGGLEVKSPPKVVVIRRLILMFAPGAKPDDKAQAELAQEIRMLGVQRMVDDRPDIKVDRRVFAVQCYGKLVLAVREQIDRIAQARACDWTSGRAPPRLRLVRVVQDLVELGADRADFLLRLSTNTQGATPVELHGANTSLLAIVMGHALGLERQELVDVAVAALFHHIGATIDMQGRFNWRADITQASLARLLAESGAGHSSYLRAVVIGEQTVQVPVDAPVRAHPYARLVKVAAAFDRLVTGFGGEAEPVHPLNALARLYNGDPADIDRDFVDLLINVLRAFPVGTRVILGDDRMAVVVNHLGGARWDRPMVQVEGDEGKIVDLALKDGGRFVGRIRGSAHFLGGHAELQGPLQESEAPQLAAESDLAALLEGEDVVTGDLPPITPLTTPALEAASEPAGDDGGLLPIAALLEAEGLDALPEEDLADATLEGPAMDFGLQPVELSPADIEPIAAHVEPFEGHVQPLEPHGDPVALPAEALLPSEAPSTQPNLQSLLDFEPLAPLAPTDNVDATIVAPSAFEDAEPGPVEAVRVNPTPAPMVQTPGGAESWSQLVPEGIGGYSEDLVVDEARLKRLSELPGAHPDTYDEEDPGET